MKLVIDNTISLDADPFEYAREVLQRYKRGEIRAYAFRVFMHDGLYLDMVDGVTEEEKESARADMLRRLETQAESGEPVAGAPAVAPQFHELFKNKGTVQLPESVLSLKQRFGS